MILREGKLYSYLVRYARIPNILETVAQMKQATRTGRTPNAPHSGGSRHGPSRASRQQRNEAQR